MKKRRLNEQIILIIRKTKLYPRLVLLFILCCFVPMISISLATMLSFQLNYRSQLNTNYTQSLNIFSSATDTMIATLNSNLTAIATYTGTQSRVLSDNKSHDFLYQSYLSNTLISENRIISIEVSSVTDVLESVRYQIFEKDIYSNPYIRRVAASSHIHYWQYLDYSDDVVFKGNNSLANKGTDHDYIIATMPIKNPISGMRIGFVSFIMHSNIFDSLINNQRENNVYDQKLQKLDFSIIDDTNTVLFSTCYRTGSILDQRIIDSLVINGTTSVKIEDSIYNIACTNSAESNLRFICTVKQDNSTLIAPLLIRFTFITVILILLASCLVMLFIKSIMNPINKMISHMRSLGENDEMNQTPIDDHANDELSELIKNYNRAIKREIELKNNLIEEEKKRQEAEYQALTSLINPHFLYNTLDMINWKAYSEGKTDIACSIQNLSEFFRLSQKSIKKPYFLKDEIALTKMYCKIQEEKNEKRIRFIFNIANNTLNCEVLNIILQPLVENAIFHGILSPNLGSGTIETKTFIKTGFLHMLVIDDGIGLNQNPIEKDTKIISNYGLTSIQNRLMFTYGEEGKLLIYPNKRKGTIAEIIIPAILH